VYDLGGVATKPLVIFRWIIMIPTQVTVNAINSAYATDDVIWGSIAPSAYVRLVKENFVPSAALVAGDLVYADFDGSDAINVPFGDQTDVTDSVTGRVGILLKEPVAGYRWVCTGDTSLPQTIYGYAVRDLDDGTLLWTGLLPNPVPIAEAGNFVEISALLGYLVINPYDSDL